MKNNNRLVKIQFPYLNGPFIFNLDSENCLKYFN